MEIPETREQISLKNAFSLLVKVLSEEENKFSKDDWQMLQVAQFLVSKEKFLSRDVDNRTLHFAFYDSFFYLDDLCERIYEMAKYIYRRDRSLIIDQTKVVHYYSDIPEKYKNCEDPTFDEALIIVNMVRNAIAHGNAELDFEHAVVNINNSMVKPDGSGDLQLNMNVSLPIYYFSSIDVGQIMVKNTNKLITCLFDAVEKNKYVTSKDGVGITIDYNGKEIPLVIPADLFVMVCYAYEKYKQKPNLFDSPVEKMDIPKYKGKTFGLQRIGYSGKIGITSEDIDNYQRNKDMKDLMAIFELLNTDPKRSLDTDVVNKFIRIMSGRNISTDFRLEAMKHFSSVVKSINYQSTTEESFDSISYVFGIKRQEKSVDFIALFNYMILLFANRPLKEGNVLLTEFLDLSTINIDPTATKDIDITKFYEDISFIILDFINNFDVSDSQFSYSMPCINLYAKTLTAMLKRLKIRNNAYIRHIRNAIEHSGVDLIDDVVELKDYVVNGSLIDKTFRSRISLDNLVDLSMAYTTIYDLSTYTHFSNYIESSPNGFLSFNYDDLFRDLEKGLDPALLGRFKNALVELHKRALNRDFSFTDNIADVSLELANTAQTLKKEAREKKGKSK